MKRAGNLWGKFISDENLTQAVYNATTFKKNNIAVRRKLGYFTDEEIKNKPEDVPLNSLSNIKVSNMVLELRNMLTSSDWQPKPYRHIQRISRTSGKVREIDCPSLEDHIIHWALIQTIRPLLLRGEYKFSCGSIKGRGIEYGRRQLETWVQNDRQIKWFVKLDVKKFYPSIDQEILKKRMRKILKDEQLLSIIDRVICSLDSGLGIGNYTSQWFGNFYLQPLDHFILEQNYKIKNGKRVNYVRHYLRYADDMILMGTSKKDLHKTVLRAIEFAKRELNLTIKPCWEIKSLDEYELDALGYRYSREKTRVRKEIFLHTKKVARRIYKVKQVQHKIHTQNAQSLLSSLGWFSHADNEYFYDKYINPYTGEDELKGAVSNACKK